MLKPTEPSRTRAGDHAAEPADPQGRPQHRPAAVFWRAALPGLLLFVMLRLAVMQSAVVVEDHDSIRYLLQIGVLAGRLPPEMATIDADFLPVFPVAASLMARTGLDLETAARLTSLLFSTIALLALLGIAHLYCSPAIVCASGLVLAVSWRSVYYDASILTEPAYVGLVYLALFLYARRFGQSGGPLYAAAIGVVSAAALLARTEGLLLAGLLPLLHLVAVWQQGHWRAKWRPAMSWCLCFAAGFAIVAGPQIVWVSGKLGRPAFNGRQAWLAALRAPGPRGYDERLWGLDYSPAVVNLDYLKNHLEAAKKLERQASLSERLRAQLATTAQNCAVLAEVEFYKLLGPIGILFFGMGLLRLAVTPRFWRPGMLCLCVTVLLLPVLAFKVKPRYLLFAMPMLALVTATGIDYAARKMRLRFCRKLPRRLGETLTLSAALALVAASHAWPVGLKIFRPQQYTDEYSPRDMQPFVEIIRQARRPGRVPVVMARKSHIGYLSGAKAVITPWTDYQGLVRYAQLNHVDFFYSQENTNGFYPFMDALRGGTPEFELLCSGPVGETTAQLYQFLGTAAQRKVRAAEVRREQPGGAGGRRGVQQK